MAGTVAPTGTNEFADAIISNLGRESTSSAARDFRAVKIPSSTKEVQVVKVDSRRVTGVDVFIESSLQPAELGAALTELCAGSTIGLQMIGNRGNTVFPVDDDRSVTLVDQYRCRFMKHDRNDNLTNGEILSLLTKVGEDHIWAHVEKLQQFNGVDAFSRTQK